jgi:hypothetical protein
MFELRWYTWDEEEYILPDGPIQYGRQAEKGLVSKKKLQYRQKVDVTVRAAAAGMWDNESLMKTANMQWSEWKDVPTVVGDNMFCP